MRSINFIARGFSHVKRGLNYPSCLVDDIYQMDNHIDKLQKHSLKLSSIVWYMTGKYKYRPQKAPSLPWARYREIQSNKIRDDPNGISP